MSGQRHSVEMLLLIRYEALDFCIRLASNRLEVGWLALNFVQVSKHPYRDRDNRQDRASQ